MKYLNVLIAVKNTAQ